MLGFTTLKEQDRFLQVVRRHLKPAGRLWIDIFQPNHGMLAESQSPGIDPAVFYVPALERTVYLICGVRREIR